MHIYPFFFFYYFKWYFYITYSVIIKIMPKK